MALQPIPLTGESYQLESRPAAQHRLVNMYAEQLPDGARSKFYLKSTPGLTLLGALGTGPIYSMGTVSSRLFAISGTHAWTSGSPVAGQIDPVDLGDVGSVASGLNHHSIAVGLTDVVFVVPPRAYTSTISGSLVAQITPGGNFPALGVSSCCYLDGYYIYTSLLGDFFFTSNLLAANGFSGQSSVKISSQLDFVEHCVAHNGELWLFGQNTISAWYNTGDPLTPFAPRTGAVIQGGCGSYRSVCDLDGSLFWLSRDGVVYRTNGYQAKRVSTHAIEENLVGYSTVDMRAIRGFGFAHEGHKFYVLSIPTINRTFVYDCMTGLWHERTSSQSLSGRWEFNAAAQVSNQWVLGDSRSSSGQLFTSDRSVVTEKNLTVRRAVLLPVLATHGPRAFMSRLEVEMETGSSGSIGSVDLSWSDDGGYTYSYPRQLLAGPAGNWRRRVVATRLGSFRQRILSIASGGTLMIYGVDVDMSVGNS